MENLKDVVNDICLETGNLSNSGSSDSFVTSWNLADDKDDCCIEVVEYRMKNCAYKIEGTSLCHESKYAILSESPELTAIEGHNNIVNFIKKYGKDMFLKYSEDTIMDDVAMGKPFNLC